MHISPDVQRVYRTAAMVGFPALLLLAATGGGGAPRQDFEEITVQRINVVEPDGGLKMVISNSALMHPGTLEGDTIAPGRVRPAGITFFDDEGDELGGMGITGDDEQRFGGLLFDQINNDETMRLVTEQAYRDGEFLHRSGLAIQDWSPDHTLLDIMRYMEELQAIQDPAEQRARAAELEAAGIFRADRLFVGRNPNGEVLVDLRDRAGRPRLRMVVEAEGAARIDFLDEKGTVVRTLDGS